jgi:hypothetical protein
MGVGSGRERVGDLSLRVFAKTIHPEWFETREHKRIGRDSWMADVRIVKRGHAIHWACGPIRLTEVLVASNANPPDLGLLYQSPIRRERSVSLQLADGIEYHTCFEAERLDREIFIHICDELVLDGEKSGLFHRFSPINRLAPPPISRIHVESRTRGLSIHTFHTFPREYAIVRTQSLFEVRVTVPR